MTVDESDGRRVKSVQLVKRSGTKLESWFNTNRFKLFEVIQQREGGFDVDLEPCGSPGEWGYLSDQEIRIVEYHDS